MTVAKIAQHNIDSADTFETVQAAAQRMATRNVGTLVVFRESGRPTGILTDRDVALRVVGRGRDPYTTRVGDVMTTELETISEDVEIEDALRRMRSRGVRRLPVVNAEGKCTGVISLDDVLTHLVSEFAVLGRLIEASTPGIE